jgi:deoxyribodipyrimidine photo-lyase
LELHRSASSLLKSGSYFGPNPKFIRRYLPALAGLNDTRIHTPWLAGPAELQDSGLVLGRDYPRPLVDHDEARQRTLARFAAARSG